ncbi:sensor histidine kinase [Brevibacterium spongiae]|uniref:histidine kinase n=1 Tax=Brevibacterium spongiae TaxID=2909672 RepID=A0ABY5SWN0_9MICO|nr:PAS domain-containing sensor histidine kinase [Brevibacterium spongiae]UVI37446.1 PAS domain-containing sensor histidine kinase [Brevibacterium spongiae]
MLNELLAAEGLTDELDVEHIHLLVGDWQLLADLSFADLVLWVPSPSGAYTVVAHARSTTGATLFNRDLIGARATGMEKELLDEASATQTFVTQVETARDLGVSAGAADVDILAEAVPIVRNGAAIAIVVRYSEEVRRRGSSRLEKYYRETAMALMRMIVQGTFPDRAAPSGVRHGEPRVGDGIFILDRDSHVQYASPNAVSLMHRLGHGGEIEGSYLAEVVSSLGAELRQVDETLPLVLTGRAPWRTELEVGRTSISLRAIPLTDAGERVGAIVLARDVSEIRRRKRELLSRDAMIKEMHHRVKNNLQTVSALLRLQTRRIDSPEAKSALTEAMRRVSIIAVVHDVLSQGVESEVDFDEVVDKGLRLTPELTSPLVHIELKRCGSFGAISSADATSLALAITELITNAIEHGFPAEQQEDLAPGETLNGHVWVTPERNGDHLRVTIADDGVGLGESQSPGNGLGTQIVRTLVSADLAGSIQWEVREGGGTVAILDVPLRPDSYD